MDETSPPELCINPSVAELAASEPIELKADDAPVNFAVQLSSPQAIGFEDGNYRKANYPRATHVRVKLPWVADDNSQLTHFDPERLEREGRYKVRPPLDITKPPMEGSQPDPS